MKRFRPWTFFLIFLSLLSSCSSGGSSGSGSACLGLTANLRSVGTGHAIASGLPTITSITTQRGKPEGPVQGGTPVFIRGTNFGNDSDVFFGGKKSPCIVIQDSTFIIATTEPVFFSGKVPVTVTTGGQIVVVENGFSYTPLVAFSSDRTGNFEIFTMSVDGFDIKQVTNNALGIAQQPESNEVNESPIFSPDGQDIVYVSNKSGDLDIFIAGRTGTTPTDLTQNDAAQDRDPAFSPEGNTIVFSSNFNNPSVNNLDGDFELFRMDRDGSNLSQLTFNTTHDLDPTFSPDGSKIAFVSNNGTNTDIFVMNSDGTNPIQVTSGAENDIDPSFSPDGSQVLFVREQNLAKELFVTSSDGTSGPLQLTFSQADTADPAFMVVDNKIYILYGKRATAKEEIFKILCTGSGPFFVFTCDEPNVVNISHHVNTDSSPSPSP